VLALALLVAAPAARAADTSAGAAVFLQNCGGCHGPKGLGAVGPTLEPAGFASLVAGMVKQGGIDMPAFAPGLDEEEIDAVAAFVSQELAAPVARTAGVQEGGELYRLYCAGCHSSTARGGALTVGRNPPDISRYPAAMALAAMMRPTCKPCSASGTAFPTITSSTLLLSSWGTLFNRDCITSMARSSGLVNLNPPRFDLATAVLYPATI
jgi:mono/diheme cytochrome c family protein